MWRWTAGGQRAPSGLMPNSLVRLKCPKSHPTVIIFLYSFPLKRLLNNLMPMYQLIFLMTAVSFLNDQSRCALQTRSHTQSNFIPPLCLHKRQLGPDPLLLLFNFHNKSPTKQKHYPTRFLEGTQIHSLLLGWTSIYCRAPDRRCSGSTGSSCSVFYLHKSIESFLLKKCYWLTPEGRFLTSHLFFYLNIRK